MDAPKPVQRYRPRKPNYYPAPPPDPDFYNHEPLDPHVLAIIRVLTIALFVTSTLYGTYAVYNTNFSGKPSKPFDVRLESLSCTYFEFNTTTQLLNARWRANVHVKNNNEGWAFRYISMEFRLQHPTIKDLDYGYKLTANYDDERGYSDSDMIVNTPNRFIEDQFVNALEMIRTSGVQPLYIQLFIHPELRKEEWPHYLYKAVRLEYNCSGFDLWLPSSGIDTRTELTIVCEFVKEFYGKEYTTQE